MTTVSIAVLFFGCTLHSESGEPVPGTITPGSVLSRNLRTSYREKTRSVLGV